MHIKHWTLLQKLRCLQRVDDASDILFIIGGDADFFVTNFAKLRLDTAAFLPNRLAEFMGKGWIKSNNEQVVEFSPMGSGVAWSCRGARLSPFSSTWFGRGLHFPRTNPGALVDLRPAHARVSGEGACGDVLKMASNT